MQYSEAVKRYIAVPKEWANQGRTMVGHGVKSWDLISHI